ncbi:hypothetical protein [Paenibacillus cymbidii]|uniref:hypothetical protein n=1 Tax=Paenibacillus cymbidii TaxID=1639034 RepID=UPI00108100FD|nr:hypothetical protein [Paenibacillus cymbidii]
MTRLAKLVRIIAQRAASPKGTVSVFLIVVLFPMFVFHGVAIDLIRAKLAERETEAAVHAGLRSVLASFDRKLQRYGLFAVSGDSGAMTDTFTDVMRRNLSSSIEGPGIRYLDPVLAADRVRLQVQKTLADADVFDKQVQQEMKYRAPLEYAAELVDKWKATKAEDRLRQTAAFSRQSEAAETLIRQLNQALDDAWLEAQTWMVDMKGRIAGYDARFQQLAELADRTGISDAEALRGALADIERDMAALPQKAGAAYEALVERKATLASQLEDITAYAMLAAETKAMLTVDVTTAEQSYAGLTAAIDAAWKANEKLREESDRAYREESGEPAARAFASVFVYELGYFAAYRTESGKALALFGGLAATSSDWSQWSDWSPASFAAAEQALAATGAQVERFRAMQAAKEAERQRRGAETESQLDEQRGLTASALQQAQQAMGGCSVFGGGDAYSALYEQLERTPGLASKYAAYNSAVIRESAEGEPLYDGDDRASAKRATQRSIGWIDAIGSMFVGFRDEMYRDEFALSKFSYRTQQSSTELSSPLSHPLRNQEAEYVLYGFGSCAANYAAAYGEMFAMLMAIRTTEALLSPQTELLNAGSPLLVFLAAAAQGAIQAAADMNRLVSGGEVPLFKKWPAVTTTYKDLLRIAFLLHSNNSAMTARLMALLELNTGVDLTKTATHIHAEALTTQRYWFMPAAMQALRAAGLAGCGADAGRCTIAKSSELSY